MAHDFNNLLTAILGYSELLIQELEPGSEPHGAATEIYGAGERAAELTRQLLAFSRKQTLRPRIIDLNEVVSGLQSMLGRLIGENIEFTVRLDPKAGPVNADSVQIERVIVNLVVNARDAMPDGGTLEIAIDAVDSRDLQPVDASEALRGRWVRLSATATGQGMDEDLQERIFEPFFTTKGPAQGTGLGLSTVIGIVEQSGGFVRVKSARGKGSTFEVYLPAQERAVASSSAESRGPLGSAVGKSRTVLLVEDDRSVRDLATSVLQAAGHRVLTAGDVAQAIEIAGRLGREIDVLLTDIVMPGMTGFELGGKLSSGRPELAVIYMSGYPSRFETSGPSRRTDATFLAKPFAASELLAAIESAAGSP